MLVILSQPRGFCAGVVRAVEIVERALDVFGAPVYVLHEIVHNPHVVNELEQRGAIFAESLDEIPPGSRVVFSAHGVSQEVERDAAARNLRVVDATCPLVRKVHLRVRRFANQGREIVLIGHAGHREVEGTRGQAEQPMHVVSSGADIEALEVAHPDRISYVTQTTLSLDDTRGVIDKLQERFPSCKGPELEDICYATQNRQNAVRELAGHIDVLVVVGAHYSSNSNRLREVGESLGLPSYLVEHPGELEQRWFSPQSRIGLTAGASTPEALVRAVLSRLEEFGATSVEEMDGVQESMEFPMPSELDPARSARR